MVNIPTTAISFNLYYQGKAPVELMNDQDQGEVLVEELHRVTEATPQFKDIQMKHIRCKGASQAIYLQGLPEMHLENVRMEDLVMESENGLICIDANGITIKDLVLETTGLPAITLHNSKNISMEGLELPESDQPVIAVSGSNSDHITLPENDKSGEKYLITLGDDVNPGVLHLGE
jgi:hypothetical protein